MVIELDNPESRRAERERRFPDIAAAQSVSAELAELKQQIDELYEQSLSCLKQINVLRVQEKACVQRAGSAAHAQAFLRHYPPQWLAEALKRAQVEVSALVPTEQKLLARGEWLAKERRIAETRAQQKETDAKLAELDRQWKAFRAQREEAQAKQLRLVTRAITEAWPEPEEAA